MHAPGRAGARGDLAISGPFSGGLLYLSALYPLLSGGKNPEIVVKRATSENLSQSVTSR
ncbi:hypothetical protein [Pantoea sp. M_9]|uniref:hypothetical protein n=1 Tax=Pantoea sp. M_9 TaxID=2608041 RepID=UPI0016809E80|nr:hypothetical protein [Pantoea sp. M_9]